MSECNHTSSSSQAELLAALTETVYILDELLSHSDVSRDYVGPACAALLQAREAIRKATKNEDYQ